MKRLTSIKLANAIMQENEAKKRDCKDFMALMNISWSAKLVRGSLLNKSYNRKKPLPSPDDIKKLSNFLNNELNNFDTGGSVTYEKYVEAVKLVQSKLISFKRRRCGELQAML